VVDSGNGASRYLYLFRLRQDSANKALFAARGTL